MASKETAAAWLTPYFCPTLEMKPLVVLFLPWAKKVNSTTACACIVPTKSYSKPIRGTADSTEICVISEPGLTPEKPFCMVSMALSFGSLSTLTEVDSLISWPSMKKAHFS
jgi:hypothetical protein